VAAPRPGGTWLEIDNFTDAAPLWWQINTCQSNGRDPENGRHRPQLHFPWAGPTGAPDHPTTAILHGWPPSVLDTPFLHMSDLLERPHRTRPRPTRLATCRSRPATLTTASLPGARTGHTGSRSARRGGVSGLTWTSFNWTSTSRPANVTSTPDTQYTITNDVHHFLVDYGPLNGAGLSDLRRIARVRAGTSWSPGTPATRSRSMRVLLSGSVSATNANVIVRSTRPRPPPCRGVIGGRPGAR